MTLGLLLTLVRRELRGSAARVAFFVACLSVGVAAVVAVAGLADSLDRALRLEARPLLAADVAVSAQRPLPEVLDELPPGLAADRVDLRLFSTMASAPPAGEAPPRSALVDLKVVDGPYPFYGVLELDPPGPLSAALGDDGVAVEPSLLGRLGLKSGDTLMLGGEPFQIRALVRAEPDRVEASLAPGPRVFVSERGLARTPLDTTAGRITHKTLFRVEQEAQAAALVRWLNEQPEVAAWTRVETWSDAQPALRQGLEQTERFLGLVALLSLIVGGAGVAQVISAWLARRMDTVAALRCLGLTPNEVVAVYLAQTAALGLLGSLVGALAGTLCLLLVPGLLGDLLPPGSVVPWQPLAALQGTALGTGVALLFAWLPLREARRVPPLRVLRRDVEPATEPALPRALRGLALIGGLGLVAGLWAGSAVVGAAFTAAVGGVVLALAGSVAGLSRGLAALGGRARSWWLRHGLVSLARPGAGALQAMTALGLGVVVVLCAAIVQDQLSARLGAGFPPDAPAAFLLDVQPAQLDGVQALLRAQGAGGVKQAPMVMGRLAAINGETTEARVAGLPDRERWAYTREQRLSWVEALPSDNTVVAGAFASDPALVEVSLEQRYADRLGVGLGDRLTFDVMGVPVDLHVTSLRQVQWESFQMNFLLLTEPGALDAAPRSHLVTLQVDADREDAVRDALAADFPNVTLVSVRALRDKAAGILGRLGAAIQALGAFTAASGVLILLASVSARTEARARQVALLKTLGTTRAGAAALLAVEYALVGLVAGTVGAVAGGGLAWALLTQLMTLPWQTPWLTLALAPLLTALGAAAAGVAGNARALAVRPGAALRS